MKRMLCVFLAGMMLLLLVGCAGRAVPMNAGKDSYADAPQAMPEAGMYEAGSYDADLPAAAEESAAVGQKLVRRVYLSAETEDYNAFLQALSAKLTALGGYFESVEAHTGGSRPSANLVIRVPADRLSELTQQVDDIGNITYRSETQQDVTLQYVDTASRIKALETEQERLLALLEQAESLTDILQIEDRLSEVRYQLESSESSLRVLENQVDYATVTLDVRQVEVFTPAEQKGYWETAGNGFVNSLENIWSFLKNLFSGLIAALPYLLLLIVLPAVIVLLIIRAIRRKKKAKAASVGYAPSPAEDGTNVPSP